MGGFGAPAVIGPKGLSGRKGTGNGRQDSAGAGVAPGVALPECRTRRGEAAGCRRQRSGRDRCGAVVGTCKSKARRGHHGVARAGQARRRTGPAPGARAHHACEKATRGGQGRAPRPGTATSAAEAARGAVAGVTGGGEDMQELVSELGKAQGGAGAHSDAVGTDSGLGVVRRGRSTTGARWQRR